MSRTPRSRVMAVGTAVVLTAAGTAIVVAAPAHAAETAPVLLVQSVGVSPEQARALQGALGIPLELPSGKPINISMADGSVRYVDEARFLHVPVLDGGQGPASKEGEGPTTITKVDFEALSKLQPYPSERALVRVQSALDKAGITVQGGAPKVSNTTFEAFDKKGTPLFGTGVAALDTVVSFTFSAGAAGAQAPMVGPGVDARVAFDGEGVVTQLSLSQRATVLGPEVLILTPTEAASACKKALGKVGTLASPQLVYNAPDLSVPTKVIYPHYACGGTTTKKTQLRTQLVSALRPGTRGDVSTPTVKVSGSVSGPTVKASVKIVGGQAPYTIDWQSSTNGDLATLADQTSITYDVASPRGTTSTSEKLAAVVTDAQGVTQRAVITLSLLTFAAATPHQAVSPRTTSRIDVGTEWVGTSGGLNGSASNATGFVNRMAGSGVPTQFNWSDFNAWERDFKDNTLGGQDQSYVDDVDLTFYTGHAGADGWWFPGNSDDQNLSFPDARYGERDLEWLGIAACGPLQDTNGTKTWWQRWGDAFQGLHILSGYATVSNDNTIEGNHFADYLTRTPFLWWNQPMSVVDAWAQMAIDAQPSSVTWAQMGVFGTGGQTSFNDFFWGRGPTSADIRGSAKTGYWRISGAS